MDNALLVDVVKKKERAMNLHPIARRKERKIENEIHFLPSPRSMCGNTRGNASIDDEEFFITRNFSQLKISMRNVNQTTTDNTFSPSLLSASTGANEMNIYLTEREKKGEGTNQLDFS